MSKWIILVCAIVLTACSEEANVYGDEDKAPVGLACPLILTIPTVNVMVTSLDPLPPNLVVSLGGDAIDLDECAENTGAPYGVIRLNSYRTSGNFYVPFWPGSEDHKSFFPDFYTPMLDKARVRIFSRPTCNDDPVLRYELTDVAITWTQIFAPPNASCGGGGYTGNSAVNVQ